MDFQTMNRVAVMTKDRTKYLVEKSKSLEFSSDGVPVTFCSLNKAKRSVEIAGINPKGVLFVDCSIDYYFDDIAISNNINGSREVMDVMTDSLVKNGYVPSRFEIAESIGRSQTFVDTVLTDMNDVGDITIEDFEPRAITLHNVEYRQTSKIAPKTELCVDDKQVLECIVKYASEHNFMPKKSEVIEMLGLKNDQPTKEGLFKGLVKNGILVANNSRDFGFRKYRVNGYTFERI